MDCSMPDLYHLALSIFLIFGTYISFLPQYVKFYQKKSHRGVSLVNGGCGALVTHLNLLNYLSLKWNDAFGCCQAPHSIDQCIIHLLPLVQTISIWFNTLLLIGGYLYYWDVNFAREEALSTGIPISRLWLYDKLKVILLVTLDLLLAIAFVIMSLLGGHNSNYIRSYGATLNLIAAALISVHWIPQILLTMRIKSLGSLSGIMLLLQSSGAILTGINLAQGRSLLSSWLVWIPYVFTWLMMTTTLVLGIYYYYLDLKEPPKTEIERPLTYSRSASSDFPTNLPFIICDDDDDE